MKYNSDLTQQKLKSVIKYNSETGVFTRTFKNGTEKTAGSIKKEYVYIKIEKCTYLAHRLAWLYVYGEWPDCSIDHINGNPSDNSLINLRQATHIENSRNCKKNTSNTSGIKGVSWHNASQKWRAYINIDKKHAHLGLFDDIDDAMNAYRCAAKEHHGEFVNYG